jgi:hypothetical protein
MKQCTLFYCPSKCIGRKNMSYLKPYFMGSGFDHTPGNNSRKVKES